MMTRDDRQPIDPLIRALSERRRVIGLTAAMIAGEAGYARTSVTMWETGGSDPPLSAIRAFALAVGMDLALVTAEQVTANWADVT